MIYRNTRENIMTITTDTTHGMASFVAQIISTALATDQKAKRCGTDGDEFVTKNTIGAAIKDFVAKRFK